MSFTVISFYTPEYKDEVKVLLRSLRKFDIFAELHAIASQGTWVDNCAMKPFFIREMARKLGAVMWLDADAEVMAPIEEPDARFAVRHRDDVPYGLHEVLGAFMSGTIYFKDAGSLLDDWCKKQSEDSEHTVWDQKTLHRAWRHMAKEYKEGTYWFPKSYCQKFDEEGDDPVIIHHQASRRLKAGFKKGPRRILKR